MFGKIMFLILIVYSVFAQNSCYGIFSPNNGISGYFTGITKVGNSFFAVDKEYDTTSTQLNTVYQFDNSLNLIQIFI